MQCDRCQESIPEGDEKELHGQILCEDCYMDVVSPAKACDPWAVHSAKTFLKETGGQVVLNETQNKILQILKKNDGSIDPVQIIEQLQIKSADLEREVATLRHLEKVRGELREGKKFLCLW